MPPHTKPSNSLSTPLSTQPVRTTPLHATYPYLAYALKLAAVPDKPKPFAGTTIPQCSPPRAHRRKSPRSLHAPPRATLDFGPPFWGEEVRHSLPRCERCFDRLLVMALVWGCPIANAAPSPAPICQPQYIRTAVCHVCLYSKPINSPQGSANLPEPPQVNISISRNSGPLPTAN
jgi:hypothetical protein